MWVQKSLDRARRRLRGAAADTAATAPAATSAATPAASHASDDVVLALVRSELDRLIIVLSATLDPHMPRPDSPDRLAGALATAIEKAGGHGRPTVIRSPAGLYTPEYWHIRVAGADRVTKRLVEQLAAGRGTS